MIWNSFLLAIKAIQRNLFRSFLTILGVIIGVAAVITMVTIGRGATQSVSDQISAMGTNMLIVRPGQRRGSGANAPNFKQRDVEQIEQLVESVDGVAQGIYILKMSSLISVIGLGDLTRRANELIVRARNHCRVVF
jgi:putative ABC transport system permease protein